MKRLALLATTMLALWPSDVIQANGNGLLVSWFPPNLFVRVAYGDGHDKVWRVRAAPGEVTDFLGERLIPTDTPNDVWHVAPAYYRSAAILQNGQEQSPVVRLDGLIYGGHHTPPLGLQRRLRVGGELLVEPGTYAVSDLTISETYDIPDKANVAIGWTFDGSPLASFRYALTPTRPFDTFMFGQQWQQMTIAPGERARLVAAGVQPLDATVKREFALTPDLWAGKPAPDRFDVIVSRDGVDSFGFAMGFDPGQARGDLTAGIYMSVYGKLYPQAFHGLVMAGQTHAITGYFGGYRIGGPDS